MSINSFLLINPLTLRCGGDKTQAEVFAMRCLHLFLICAIGAIAQTADSSDPAFEFASVRPAVFPDSFFAAGYYAATAGGGCVVRDVIISGARVSLARESVCDLIAFAYGVGGHACWARLRFPLLLACRSRPRWSLRILHFSMTSKRGRQVRSRLLKIRYWLCFAGCWRIASP